MSIYTTKVLVTTHGAIGDKETSIVRAYNALSKLAAIRMARTHADNLLRENCIVPYHISDIIAFESNHV